MRAVSQFTSWTSIGRTYLVVKRGRVKAVQKRSDRKRLSGSLSFCGAFSPHCSLAITRTYMGGWRTITLASAADLFAQWWPELWRCKHEPCGVWFLPPHVRQRLSRRPLRGQRPGTNDSGGRGTIKPNTRADTTVRAHPFGATISKEEATLTRKMLRQIPRGNRTGASSESAG